MNKCPHCGKNIESNDIKNPRIGKKEQLVGGLVFGLGLMIIFFPPILSTEITSGWALTGLLAILGGAIIHIRGRFLNWYHWK